MGRIWRNRKMVKMKRGAGLREAKGRDGRSGPEERYQQRDVWLVGEQKRS